MPKSLCFTYVFEPRNQLIDNLAPPGARRNGGLYDPPLRGIGVIPPPLRRKPPRLHTGNPKKRFHPRGGGGSASREVERNGFRFLIARGGVRNGSFSKRVVFCGYGCPRNCVLVSRTRQWCGTHSPTMKPEQICADVAMRTVRSYAVRCTSMRACAPGAMKFISQLSNTPDYQLPA